MNALPVGSFQCGRARPPTHGRNVTLPASALSNWEGIQRPAHGCSWVLTGSGGRSSRSAQAAAAAPLSAVTSDAATSAITSSAADAGVKQDKLQAVVVGGGLAGLTAAQALCQLFDEVTLVERDPIDSGSVGDGSSASLSHESYIEEVLGNKRPGVPQFTSPHVILRRGLYILSELFGVDDFRQVFIDAGAHPINWLRECDMYTMGAQMTHDFDLKPAELEQSRGVCATRSLYEGVVRRELIRRNKNLSFTSGVAAQGLQFADDNNTVRGLHLSNGVTLEADLVVDASGRNSKTPGWLRAAGRGAPPVERASSGAGYGSRYLKLKPGMQGPGRAAGVFDKRGGFFMPIEHGIYQIVMHGYLGDHPPSDDAGYLSFAQSLPGEPHIYEGLKKMDPLTPVNIYKGTDNCRHRYDQINMPEGFVVLGDAVATFNPIYGQGMTVGMMGVEMLRDLVTGRLEAAKSGSTADRSATLVGLPQEFQKRLLELTKTPWNIAMSEDMKRTGAKVEGSNPLERLITGYLEYLSKLALTEGDVRFTMWKVQHLVDDPSVILAPRMVATAASCWLRARTAALWQLLPGARQQQEAAAGSNH